MADTTKHPPEEAAKASSGPHNQGKEQPKSAPKKAEKGSADKQRIAELTDTLQRLQAEFENHKKRTEKEQQQFKTYAEASSIQELLPIIDSFELALQNTQNTEQFVKGMQVLYNQFMNLLKSKGLKPIDTTNQKLDPHLHEVMMREPSEKEPDTILAEFQKGYVFKETVLRHSKVKVATLQDGDNKSNTADTNKETGSSM